MKLVSELYGRHNGADIYVIGSGASMRVFPHEFFQGKITIALNQGWKVAPATYAITIHPDLNIPEFMPGEVPHPEITWITGNKKTQSLLKGKDLDHALENFYFFNYQGQENTAPIHEPSTSGRMVTWLEKPTEDYLYVWSSISQAGANLAANMGAKNVILVGCDNCSLAGNHHAHDQHTRWKGVEPDHRYQQYYEGIAEVRKALRKRNVNLVSMNPFLKLDDPFGDFSSLCNELGMPSHIESRDVSPRHQSKKKGWFNWLSM